MPVTLTTTDHPSRSWRGLKSPTTEALFREACPEDHRHSQRVIGSSFPNSFLGTSYISGSQHGFVWSVSEAYSNHHHLTIRPEDVWFSILTQLGFYINAHAEELRSFFVAHEGQKQLKITTPGTLETANLGALAQDMTRKIEENVLDKELRTWMMPEFTTTTETDQVVAAILMMGSMQKYFSYSLLFLCGIPSVTLLGEREDWTTLVKKLDKLHQLGDEPAEFARLLRPVLNNFVASFDSPESPAVRDFWSKCADRKPWGSGSVYLSGWISAFCFWNETGQIIDSLTHSKSTPEFEARNTELDLNDALSRCVNTDSVPSGFAAVPVTVNDNGITFHTMMVAGLVGIQVTSSRAMPDGTLDPNDRGLFSPNEEAACDSIQPLSGWWMYEKKTEEK